MKKQEFSKQLIPALENRQFKSFPVDKSLQNAFPLGVFKRETESVIHQIEVQIDKYNKDKFRIFFGIIPKAGIYPPNSGHIKAEDTLVTWLTDYYVLYRSPFFKTQLRQQDLEKAENLVQEIDDVLRTGKKGKYTRHVVYYRARTP